GAKETDVAAQGPARGARRAAIDVRRAHGKYEGAVGARIARPRSAPVARGSVRRDGSREIALCVCHVRGPVHEHKIEPAEKPFYPERGGKVKSAWKHSGNAKAKADPSHRLQNAQAGSG